MTAIQSSADGFDGAAKRDRRIVATSVDLGHGSVRSSGIVEGMDQHPRFASPLAAHRSSLVAAVAVALAFGVGTAGGAGCGDAFTSGSPTTTASSGGGDAGRGGQGAAPSGTTATAGAGGGAGMGGGASTTCHWSANHNPCTTGWYCNALDCVSGSCEPRPPALNTLPTALPVCGCDGVTYWNAEFAAVKGMAVASPGACAAGLACSPGGNECASSDHCSAQVDSFAGCPAGPIPWSCWSVPANCPPDATDHLLCNGDVSCYDLCTAAKSGAAFYPGGADCS